MKKQSIAQKKPTACCPTPTAPKRKSGPSMKSKPVKEMPPPEEWDFRNQPDNNELLACLIYEYAREKLKGTPDLLALLPKLNSTNLDEFLDADEHLSTALFTAHGCPHLFAEMQSTPFLKLSESDRKLQTTLAKEHVYKPAGIDFPPESENSEAEDILSISRFKERLTRQKIGQGRIVRNQIYACHGHFLVGYLWCDTSEDISGIIRSIEGDLKIAIAKAKQSKVQRARKPFASFRKELIALGTLRLFNTGSTQPELEKEIGALHSGKENWSSAKGLATRLLEELFYK